MANYDVFISYRRSGGEYTAKILRDRLEDMGYRVFFDVESLRSGYFNTKLYSVIDECRDFLLILSPGALDRCANPDDWVRLEVERALAQEKNIIPIMLRGFDFPQQLPESLEPLRFRHGLEANSQFFDAFIQQLCEKFLMTRPGFWQRLKQDTVFRRTLPALLALAIVIAAGFGGKALYDSWNSGYPKTAGEKNLTGEVLYCAETNLTNMDLIAGAMNQALQASRRALTSGGQGGTWLSDQFERSRQTMERIDLESCAPTDGLLARMNESPFKTADLSGMYASTKNFLESCMGDLDYLETMTGPDYYLSAENKLEILDCYETIVNNTLYGYAWCCNELLLPVTETKALEEFWYTYLPELTCVPLRASEWQTEYALLESNIDRSENEIDSAVLQLSTLVGNTATDTVAMREALIRYYMAMGFARSDMELLLEKSEKLSELMEEARTACLPKAEDDEDTLWWKMMNLLSLSFCDEARTCVELFSTKSPDSGEVTEALYRFIDYIEKNGVTYGVMVREYYLPDGINENFRIGDIIVSFNGEPCGSLTTYTQMKNALTEKNYTLEVLRVDDSGKLQPVTLEMTTDMPRVRLATVVYDGTDI